MKYFLLFEYSIRYMKNVFIYHGIHLQIIWDDFSEQKKVSRSKYNSKILKPPKFETPEIMGRYSVM